MFQVTERQFEVEPQITFEITGVTAEMKADLSKRLCHATHVDWERDLTHETDDAYEVTFDVEFEDVFHDWARDYADELEYHAI